MATTEAEGEATAEVTSERKGIASKAEKRTKRIKADPIEGEPAHVAVKVGHTRNMGNYSSLRIDVEVTLPCAQDAVEETLTRASDIARRHAASVEDNWNSFLNGEEVPDGEFKL